MECVTRHFCTDMVYSAVDSCYGSQTSSLFSHEHIAGAKDEDIKFTELIYRTCTSSAMKRTVRANRGSIIHVGFIRYCNSEAQ